ncbi:DGQHR domain-containing protein [Sphingomonas histidinilytica]|uniref:DGQHR domain-containing protein DpdB n=1 Tax=Rhizorhabdus histidinilytica TaxID=439228 RepID=UPI001ADC294B|nr:DGQHR domain-containing protein DpdB [Rhizorhabdus histidinilytica]MBO9376950.1 DGQHR domain-containing protein [Rhizorhabdus histidinilytica]
MTYLAVCAQQSSEHKVLSFAAKAADVLRFAAIDRIGRDAQGELSGFQRPQVAAHIREIRDYLEKPNAVLPNPIVVAFTDRVSVEDLGNGAVQLAIDMSSSVPGLVVDGQQRLSALADLDRDFQVFVSALICRDEAELRRQFVLINNTKPLPKSLIYELLPTVGDLPPRLSRRSVASDLTARLNFENTALKGYIKQHTCPEGIIADTVMQKIIMESLSNGVMRELIRGAKGEERCVRLMSNFFDAVKKVWPEAWHGQKPNTSRLLHGAGIQAMGDVMEVLAERGEARTVEDFRTGMECLKDKTAWTAGEWYMDGEVRRWNGLQNVNRDVALLKHYLVGIVKADLRKKAKRAPAPLLEPTADRS